MGWFDIISPPGVTAKAELVVAFHVTIAVLVVIVLYTLSRLLTNTVRHPSSSKGWADIDFDANQGSRDSLVNYMAANNLPADTTPMNKFSIATANFGGIFTESTGLMNPWIGTVSSEAATLQVVAGARAIVLDIWPDPADRQKPVVCAMLDTQAWTMQSLWMKMGLDKGVGRYSNWQRLTRNSAPVGEILQAALKAAFGEGTNQQATDPFFVILKLHGAMTTDYLNHLGDIVQSAIGGRAMSPEWNGCANQKSICTAPVDTFMSKVFVTVIPDIQPGYNSLPGVNTYAAFTSAFLKTHLGEATNALEQNPNTMLFDPGAIGAVSAATQPACGTSPSAVAAPPQSLAQIGFCLIQPSIGGHTSDNSDLFSASSYTACLQSGAQFVAVNLFSQNGGDGPLSTFFDPSYFGKYSFRKI